MTRTSRLASGFLKEVRALVPVWGAATLGLVAAAFVAGSDRRFSGSLVYALGVLVYALGAVLLGAQSVGHEYTHRTMASLLAQSVDRRRLYVFKCGAAALMLLLTGSAAWALLPGSRPSALYPGGQERLLISVATMSALSLAPLLTMLSRSALAGFVFTVAIPPAVLILADLVGLSLFGFQAAARIDSFKAAAFWPAMFVICGVAAVASWRVFTSLEVVEGPGREIRLPRWIVPARAEPDTAVGRMPSRGPIWQLLKKELKLQHLTLVVAALYVPGWATVALLNHLVPGAATLSLGVLTTLYFGLLSILIGSLASAEERQSGTLEWQMVLPVAAWQQWALKVSLAVALANVLAAGLPIGLWQFTPLRMDLDPLPPWTRLAAIVTMLTICSLYVSSLCSGGVRAMVLFFPFLAGVALMVRVLTWLVWTLILPPLEPASVAVFMQRAVLVEHLLTALVVIFAVALLWAGFLNHRTADRTPLRIAGQLAIIAALLVAVTLTFAAMIGPGEAVLDLPDAGDRAGMEHFQRVLTRASVST